PLDPLAAEAVAAEPGEQIVEHLLADPPCPAGSQLEPVALPREIPGTLELAGQLVEPLELAHRVVAKQVLDAVAIEPGEVARPVDVAQRILERIEGLQAADLLQRAVEAQLLVAAEPEAVAEPTRDELIHRRPELGEVPAQAVVAEERVHHVLQLGPLLLGHR